MKKINLKLFFLLSLLMVTGCQTKEPIKEKSLVEKAQNYYSNREWDKSIQEYTKLINSKTEPKYTFYFHRGIAFKQIKQLDNAVNDFKEANKLDEEKQCLAALEIAKIGLIQKKYLETYKFLSNITPPRKLESKFALLNESALNALININLKQGNYKAVLKYTNILLQKKSDNMVLLSLKLEALSKLIKSNEERTEFNTFIDSISKTLPKNSPMYKKILKHKAINFFYLKKAIDAKRVIDSYIELKENKLTKDDIFWAGLINKVSLHPSESEEYWSYLNKGYIDNKLKEIKKTLSQQ